MNIVRAESLREAVAALFGPDVRVVDRRAVFGGDINTAYRLTLTDGGAVFMKCNAPSKLTFFEAEAAGLHALRSTHAIGVPRVLALGTDRQMAVAFLLLEYLEGAPAIGEYWEVFGRELAAMHRADCGRMAQGKFGFDTDNFIGATPQINTPSDNWAAFFRDCRLRPQMDAAAGYLDRAYREKCERLLARLDRYLPEPTFPSLIHGDLWSGNALRGPDGKAWILDPAVYVGHFEAELAMTELFAGFPAAFYGAYNEVNHIDSGYRERREIYNLYHLMNHLNLFGTSYLGSVKRILARYA